MRPVDSSSIAAIGYERSGRRLIVQFRQSERVYAYFDVPRSVFEGLCHAASKGGFFNDEIKPNYLYERVSDRAVRQPPRRPRAATRHSAAAQRDVGRAK